MSSDWPEYSLEELCDFQNGFAFKNSDYIDSGESTWEVFRMGNIARGGGYKEDSRPVFISKNYPKKLGQYGLCKGDLTIAMTDMKNSMALLGHTARVPISNRFMLNQRVGRIRVRRTDTLCPLYLYYFSNSPDYIAYLRSRANSGVQVNLSTSAIKESVIKVPPLEVQRVIGDALGNLDNKIQINNQINQTLEQMAQAIFKSWFVDFEPVKAKIAALEAGGCEDDALLAAMQAIAGSALFATAAADTDAQTQLARLQSEHPEQYATLRATAELFPSAMQESELGEIPGGWSVESVSDLFELHRGFDLPKNSREEGPFEVYAAGGLHGTHSEFKMEPPGIITGRSGVIGNVYLSLKKYWPLNTTLYVREFRACGPYYAYHLLGSLDLKALNSGSAVPSLNRNFVHSLATLKPCSGLLDMFEVITNSYFKEIVVNIDQNESLAQLRDTLLPKLLSGELSVSAATDQIAQAEEAIDV